MASMLSAYDDILTDVTNDTPLPKRDTSSMRDEYDWFGTGGAAYFTSLSDAQRGM